MITLERAQELLRYDPDTGELFWLVRRTNRANPGTLAGYNMYQRGKPIQVVVGVDGKLYGAHRIAWLLTAGAWPPECIDHVDRNPFNNKFSNLRLATRAENNRNRVKSARSTSGYKGVSYHKGNRSWSARIGHENKLRHLGSFGTPEAAHTAYCEAAKQLHGSFANSGSNI